MVRSLGSAGPVGGVRLRLVAVNNEVLGEATSDAEGYANFAPGLIRGTGGWRPGCWSHKQHAGDYSFLDLSKAAMDLTDRGVEGRDPPKPLDVFLTTERGIYRVGETVYATSLVRDATANAVLDVPLTAIVTRPDGKEDSRVTLQDQGLGGTVTPVNLCRQRHARHLADRRLCRRQGPAACRDDLPGRGFRAGAARFRHRDDRDVDRPQCAGTARPLTRASSTARRPATSTSKARRC